MAANIAPGGFAKIAHGALDSYKGINKQIDAVIARKGDIMKLVDNFTGDGNFKTTINKDPKTMKLTVRAQGKTLSEVFPAGALVPFAAIGLLVSRSAEPRAEVMAVPAPSPTTKKR
jgi:hypothetical protein